MANTNRLSIAELCSRTETVLRTRHYSRSTITSYVFWLRKFLERYWYCPVEDLGETEITAFLSDLAIRQNVAASTQNQALSAVLFFFKQVLGRELELHVPRGSRPVSKRFSTFSTSTSFSPSRTSWLHWHSKIAAPSTGCCFVLLPKPF